MTELGLSNADLVKASTEQLTFKMVQKARKGKPLTPNVRNKIIAALKTLGVTVPGSKGTGRSSCDSLDIISGGLV